MSTDKSANASLHDEAALSVPTVNPLDLVHRLLRGRYRQACLLGGTLAALGLVGGYLAVKPEYRAVGKVLFTPTGTRLVHETDENKPLHDFHAFVDKEANAITNRAVLEQASLDPALARFDWPQDEKGVAALEGGIEVIRDSGQLVLVRFTDTDPKLAQTAVNAVIDAYASRYGESNERVITSKERLLSEREATIENELREINARLLNETGGLGADALQDRHEALVREVDILDQRIESLRRASSSPSEDLTTDYRRVMWDIFAAGDRVLTELLTEELKASSDRAALPPKYGSNHPAVRAADEKVRLARTRVERRIESLLSVAGLPAGVLPTDPATPVTPADLGKLADRLATARAGTGEEVAELGRKLLAATTISAQLEKSRKLLDDTRLELEKISSETTADLPGRVQIAERAEIPLTTSRDRRKVLAVMGAAAGFCAGVGLIAVSGLVNRKIRYVDELENLPEGPPVIGVLPEVAGHSLSEQSRAAALSIHHLRNMIQLPDSTRIPAVYMVTSPAAGDGKTSLTLALGMSFATAGYKVCVADADLVGRGLTSELRERGSPGLCDAFDTGDASRYVRPTQTENLSILPVGLAHEDEVERLSKSRIAPILDNLRARYDIVLVDCGPLLGSIDAHLVAGLADAVLLVVSRGSSERLVHASLARLEHLGIEPRGVIFNKAEQNDFDKCLAYGSLRETQSRSSVPAERVPEIVVPRRTLARAMRAADRNADKR